MMKDFLVLTARKTAWVEIHPSVYADHFSVVNIISISAFAVLFHCNVIPASSLNCDLDPKSTVENLLVLGIY